MNTAFIIGIVSFFGFLIGNIFLGSIVGLIIPGGNDFQNSYFYPLYVGVTMLISLVISCTYMIIKKIDSISKKNDDDDKK